MGTHVTNDFWHFRGYSIGKECGTGGADGGLYSVSIFEGPRQTVISSLMADRFAQLIISDKLETKYSFF